LPWGAILLLARAHETGELGRPDPAEAARLYCLLLRHHGSHLAALLLSRLHARGEGVAFSPALADHFARIAGIALEPDRGLKRLLHWLRGNGAAAADLAVLDQLRDALRWWRAMAATPARPLHRRIRQYIAGTSTPRSQLLTDELYDILVQMVLSGRDNGAILVAYIRYKTGVADGAASLSESEADWLQMIAYEAAADRKYPPAQAMIGRFYLTGEVFPRSDLLAFMWLSAAKASGEDVATDLAAVQRRVPAADARHAREFLALGILPPIVSRQEKVREFRAQLAH
jgi:TPR repeat protein